ncbi:hypothetical protein Pyn_24722 [Prunus yedoensis var. nudiflora]|uniref:Uncharacterized protein n=1 Tax=Prunus yedoensis var. nudiflora TaxID=2094558 RepID=A0A314YCG7_PRUYE|nr:hypothetical protein Pyn_24722 [Prunus yedoensis var. nudiflora]
MDSMNFSSSILTIVETLVVSADAYALGTFANRNAFINIGYWMLTLIIFPARNCPHTRNHDDGKDDKQNHAKYKVEFTFMIFPRINKEDLPMPGLLFIFVNIYACRIFRSDLFRFGT